MILTPSYPIHLLIYLLDDCIYSDDAVARVLYAVQHGHQVESHTWSHKDLTTLSADQSQYQPTRPSSLVLCLILHNLTLPFLLQFMTRCGGLNVSFILSFPAYLYLMLFLSFLLVALMKIAGVYPAFMRPRTSFVDTILTSSL